MSLRYPVKILTDHKNLEYFRAKRTLSKRQTSWKNLLDSLPSISIRYRPGKEATRPDALSRLEQDTPKNLDDARLKHKEMQLINDSWITNTDISPNTSASHKTKYKSPFDDEELTELWHKAIDSDGEYREIEQSIINDKRCFPPSIVSKLSISECTIGNDGFVRGDDC